MDATARVDGVPWFPASLHPYVASPGDARRRWRYVVIEEIADGAAELVSWPWPLADQLGRLFWPDAGPDVQVSAVVGTAMLREQLYRPSGLQRKPRAGDTFAVERALDAHPAAWSSSPLVTDLHELFPGLVLDVSADAREAAKLAYLGAHAAVPPGTEPLTPAPLLQQPAPVLTVDAPRGPDR